tara:strand:- start:4501 stop:4722 length:222 start_codon:yes stop_codon:yes gene_type:complete
MTPMGYVGIAVIIGGGYMSIKQLRDMYLKGCHTPAMYLLGGVGTVGIGLWVLKSYGSESEEVDEEEAEWVEYF